MQSWADEQLERARSELQVSLALARPDSPAGVLILGRLAAIDAELASREGSPWTS